MPAAQPSLNFLANSQEGLVQPFDPASLPGKVSQAVWRATDLGQAVQAVVSTGFPDLDAQLPGGGWPCNALTEVLQAQPSLCEWRLVGRGLRPVVADGGQLLVVGPPKKPHAPGLADLGLSEKNLVCILAETPAERLWTTEQLIKSNPKGAILTWLPQVRPEQLRRLQAHAQDCDCPIFIFRNEQARLDSSPAPLRVLAGLGLDWQLKVQILKRRGGVLEEALELPSIPGTLEKVLTPRLLRPSLLIAKQEPANASLGSIAERRRLRQLASH